jgi:hypothetical protein
MEDWLEFMLRRGEELARRVIITGSVRTGRTWSRRLYGPTWQSLRHKAKAESFMKTLKESEWRSRAPFRGCSLAAVNATSPVSGAAAAKRQEPFHRRSALSIYLVMALLDLELEMPLPSVLDDTDTDKLLVRLRLVHGEPRFDIAPELFAARRRARLPASDT